MIDLLPNADQDALSHNFAEVLASEAPLSRLRSGGFEGERALVRQLAVLGWIGIGIAECDGGLGLGIVEEMLLMHAAGRHLIGTTLLATMLAASIADDETRARLIAGESAAALAIPAPDGTFRIDHGEGDLTLLLDASGRAILDTPLSFIETTAIDDAVFLERGATADTTGGIDLSLKATVLVAAYLVGLAERARDMAADYARTREQFGQPIGAFQGIKHRCADMAVSCEAAWSLTIFAALALAEGRADAAFQVEAARIVSGDAAISAARGNIQVHGGIGFTAECDAQLLVKRLQIWLQIGGTNRQHRARLAAEAAPWR